MDGIPLRACTLASIDFETTGTVRGHPSEPWQVGVVVVRDGALAAAERWQSLIRTGDRPFSPHAPGAHHALRAEIARAPSLEALRPELEGRCLGRVLVAHNVPTERSWLRRLSPLHRWGPWVDTLRLSRAAFPGLDSYALEDLVPALGLEPDLRALSPAWMAHDALSDALAAALLLWRVLNLPGWENLTARQAEIA